MRESENVSFVSFIRAFTEELFTAMSGGLSVPLAILSWWISNQTGKYCVGILAMTCWVIACYRVWKSERQKAIYLQAQIERESQAVRNARLKLAELRIQGAKLRNDGSRTVSSPEIINISDERSYIEWEIMIDRWNEEVITEIGKIDEANAKWFSLMDVIPLIPRVPVNYFHDTHALKFRTHDERLRRLGDMLEKTVS